MAIFYPQKILTTNKTEVTFAYNNYSSMIFTNSHASSAVTIDLYATSQIGTDITATSIYAKETEAKSTSSVLLEVDDNFAFTEGGGVYNNDPTIEHTSDSRIVAGLYVFGTGIPADATIASITDSTHFELSASTTGGSLTGQTLGFELFDIGATISDAFLNERVYKADGSFFGTCTAVDTGFDILTFSGGLERVITDNDVLQTGTRHHFLNNVKIPNGASLKLTADEFKFDTANYKLYIKTDAIGIDIITRY